MAQDDTPQEETTNPYGQAAPGTFIGLQELEEEALLIEQFGLTVGELEEMRIITSDGETIGEVDEILLNAEGRIVAVSAEIGGFLDIGDREVVLGLEQLSRDGNRLRVDMTARDIEDLPTWQD
jgi:sporulation protein YlmC with PRC-barrel domain